MAVVPSLAAAYLLGSIPFGFLIGLIKGVDIRGLGSRNIGATNVLRVCGWKWGVLALALDALKGFLAVAWTSRLAGAWPPPPFPALLSGVAAVLGHNFPAWLRFRGGKGVAATIGAMAGLMWIPLLAFLAVFAVAVAATRYISMGSMLGSAAFVLAAAATLPDTFGADLPLMLTALAL